jgi:tape measure domain-containing protein
MAEQLNIQFGVDASRVVQAAEQAGALAGKLFGKQFNQAAEEQLDDVEVQLDLNFAGAEQAKRATKSIEALRARLKKANDEKKKSKELADKMALADAKAANKKKALAKAIGKVPLKAHAKQLQTAINKLKALRSQATKGSEAYKRLGASIKGLNTRLANIKGGNGPMQLIGGAAKGLIGKFTAASVASGLLQNAIQGLGRSVVETFNAFGERTKQVEALTLALQNAGIEGKDVQGVMGSIKATALTFGTTIEDVSAAWKRLAPTVLAAGGNLKQTEDIIVAMSARTVGLGLNTEQTARYMEALAQVMGKGKLQGEELTKQLSQLDGALRSQIEEDLKNTVEGFTNLEDEMRKGAVTADMFAESFVRVSQGAVENLTGQMFNLTTQIKDAGDASGLTLQQIENKINTLNTMTLDSFAAVFDNLGKSFLRVQAGFAQLGQSLVNSMPATMKLIEMTFTGVGKTIEITFQSVFGTIKLLGLAIETILTPARLFGDLMGSLIPPDLQTKIQGVWGEITNMNNKLFEALMSLGNNGQKQISFLEKVDEALEENSGNWEELGEKLKDVIDENISKLEEQVQALKDMYEEEKALIQDVIEAQKAKLEEEKIIYDEAKRKAEERYESELSQIEQVRQALNEAYGREMAELDKKTASEIRLQEIRRAELVAKTKNLSLSEKERVAAQAQLDAMDRREKKQALMLRNRLQNQELDKLEEASEGRKDAAIEKSNKRYEQRKKLIEANIKTEEAGIKKIDKEIEKLDTTIKRMKRYEKEAIFENRDQAILAIDAQINYLDGLITKWKAVETAAKNAASAGKGANPGGGNSGFNALGGPVSSGRTYTVNEVGQEAFLSAAGKLSMIDAPSWGEWTAPSSGTVIPAHLTQQLDIPKGGININSVGTPRISRKKLMSKQGGQKTVAFIRNKMNRATKKASELKSNSKPFDGKKGSVIATLGSPKVEASLPPFVSKQIDIPSTKVRSKQSSSATSASGGGILQIARAIRGMQGGSSINNNVTVQSNNPTQTANNMLVELTKVRRRRMGR